MKRKLLCVLVILLTMQALPSLAITIETKGSKNNPYTASKNESATINIESYEGGTYKTVTADITVKVVGKYGLSDAIETIEELTLLTVRGAFVECYKVLVQASNIKGGNSIVLGADNFKLYDYNSIEAKILTQYEMVELLNDTGAYLYLGVNTVDAYARYLVFDNSAWFDVFDAEGIEK